MDCGFLSIDKKRRVQLLSDIPLVPGPLMRNSLHVILSFVPVTFLIKATSESKVGGVGEEKEYDQNMLYKVLKE